MKPARTALLAACLFLAACNPNTEAADPQAEAEAYVRENINTLSPETAELGGTFYVTEIEWLDSDTMRISYEDGHVAYVATADIVTTDDETTVESLVLEEQPERYRNETYGYALDVPADYELTVYSDISQAASAEVSNDNIVQTVNIEVIEDADVDSRLLLTCAADGVSTSIDCPDVESRTTVTTEQGLIGERIMLNETITDVTTQTENTGVRGPYYVFEMPSAGSGVHLVIYPSASVPRDQIDDAHVDALVDSLVLLLQ